jgi:membrane protein DedA with SNARE-associated domain
MGGLITSLIEWLVNLIGSLGYPGIFFGMALESSFIPFPSEVILPPAGVLIARGEMLPSIVLLTAILGTLIGALVNYTIALHFGRRAVKKLAHKYGKIFFLDETHIEKSEEYFKKHGTITTFTGRLIPGIRQIISIPAGFARMNLSKFIIFTTLGSSIWSIILISIGFIYGDNQEKIDNLLGPITILLLFTVAIIIISYIIIKKRKTK